METSSEVIREMSRYMTSVADELALMAHDVRRAGQSLAWDDPQGREYAQVMESVARLAESPAEQLRGSSLQLEKLARIVDEYTSVKFG